MRSKISILLGTVLAIAIAGVALAQPDHLFFAELSGENERPNAVDTDTTGTAKFRLDGDTLHFELKIEDGEDIVAGAGAHIHCGGPDVSGPIAVYLANGLLPAGTGFDGDIQIKASLNDDNVIATDCGDTLAALIQSMRDGNTYVNVHSVANPGGEIRGQIGPPGGS